MRLMLTAAVAALTFAVATPASAGLYTYSFTAGSDSSRNTGSQIRMTCGFNYEDCNETQASDNNFTLSGSFILDTAKLGANRTSLGYDYNTGGSFDPSAQFVTSEMARVGGLPDNRSAVGVNDYSWAQAYTTMSGTSFWLQASQISDAHIVYEFHENGQLARQAARKNFTGLEHPTGMGPSSNVATYEMIDGVSLVTGFSDVTRLFATYGWDEFEYTWDEWRNLTSYVYASAYSRASLDTLTFGPVGGSGEPEEPTGVPEPAMLGLFGIGLIGLAARRRRKTS